MDKKDQCDFSSEQPFVKCELIRKKFPENLHVTLGHRILPNPGRICNLHQDLVDIKPKWFSGVEFGYRLNVAENQVIFGTVTPNELRFGGFYTPNFIKNLGQCPHLEVDINPRNLGTNFKLMHFTHNFLIKFASKAKSRFYENVFGVDYIRAKATASLEIINPSERCQIGSITLGYFHNVTSRISVGTELSYEWAQPAVPAGNASITVASKYRDEKVSLAGKCSNKLFDISYWQALTSKLQIGSSLVVDKKENHTLCSMVGQYKTCGVTLRGMLDSDWNVGLEYEKRIMDLCLNVGLSVLFSVATGKVSTGLKFNFEPDFIA